MTDQQSRGAGGWRRGLTAVTAAALGTALLAACGAGDERTGGDPDATTGVTDDSVTIGATFPLTGVAAPGYSEIPTGAQAYFDYVNANGGVHGRKIDYIVRDDGYDPTKTSQVTRELVLEDEIFAMVGSLGTPTHSAVVDYLNSQGIPDLFVSSGSLQWGDDVEAKPYTFGWQPDYESEGKIIGQWVKENLPDARVGLFLQDDDLGRDSEQGIRRYLDDQIVDVERYTSGNTDVAPQIAGLQAAKVDLVLGFNTPSYTALSQLVARKLNFDPKWYYSSIGSDPALVGSLLARFSEGAVEDGGSAMDGILTSEYIPGVDAPDNPWTKLWQQVWDAYGEKGELTNYRIYGMSHAYAFVQALEAAGEDLTRDGIVDALEQAGTELEGPQLAPFRYTSGSHMGISGVQLVEIRDGVSEPITPVLVTDIGDAPIEKDTSDQADDAPPDGGIPTG